MENKKETLQQQALKSYAKKMQKKRMNKISIIVGILSFVISLIVFLPTVPVPKNSSVGEHIFASIVFALMVAFVCVLLIQLFNLFGLYTSRYNNRINKMISHLESTLNEQEKKDITKKYVNKEIEWSKQITADYKAKIKEYEEALIKIKEKLEECQKTLNELQNI